MKNRIFIAVSGGIDSLVAALLLKESGQDPAGIHFITGYEKGPCKPAGIVEKISAQTGTGVEILDLSEAFRELVVDPFVDTYKKGRTPNPCLLCNSAVKFGVLFSAVREKGAARLATGHYARVEKGGDGLYHLLKGKDPQKDQSYFLSFLTQSQLAGAVFPIGNMTKDEVRALGERLGIRPVAAKESQDICFIPDADYVKFLSGQPGFFPRPGPITNARGKKIGQHKGLHLFTVGQRRGIDIPAAEPYYVLEIDSPENRLVVGKKSESMRPACEVSGINWIQPRKEEPFQAMVKIRYRHREVACLVRPSGDDKAEIEFETPQAAVAPGQGAVFYKGDEVIGGGWIENAKN